MSEKDFESITKGKLSRKKKRIALIVAAALSGVAIANVTATILVHDSFFSRYERPNYALYPGLYSYERISSTLPRENLTVKSKNNSLAAYYYPSENARGLCVIAHGIHAGADDFLPWIEAIVKEGYSVLAYDVTGTYSSEGEGTVGMCQSLIDLDYVLNFANKDLRFRDLPKVLFGHSWGGYAVSSVLALHPEVRACVAVAPMHNGATMMIEKAEQYVGDFAKVGNPVLSVYQRILFGDYVKYNATVGINASNAHILIAQGKTDTIITPDGQSITAHLSELTNPNVKVYWTDGLQGSHNGILHSVEAEEYKNSTEARIKDLENKLSRKLTDEERIDFYKTVDHRLYSDVNAELLRLTIETFDKGLK